MSPSSKKKKKNMVTAENQGANAEPAAAEIGK